MYFRCECGAQIKQRFSAPWMIGAGLGGIMIGVYESSPLLPGEPLARFLIAVGGFAVVFAAIHWWCTSPVLVGREEDQIDGA